MNTNTTNDNIKTSYAVSPLGNESVGVYDFSVLKKSFPIKSTNLTSFKLPNFEEVIKVKNQQEYWACAAFATSIILEYMNYTEKGSYTELSPGYIYGKHRSPSAKGSGMNMLILCNSLLNYGSVPTSVFSRVAEMPEMKKIVDQRPDLDEIAIPYRIKGFAQIKTANKTQRLEDVKLALINTKAPLYCVINSNTPQSHAICVYGFETVNGKTQFLYQNSYGPNWGKKGRSSLSLEDLDHIVCFLDEKVSLPFKDVPEDAWFYKHILNLYSAGLINGKTDTEFKPNDYITRAEVVAIIDRLIHNIDKVNSSTATSVEDRIKRIEEFVCLY